MSLEIENERVADTTGLPEQSPMREMPQGLSFDRPGLPEGRVSISMPVRGGQLLPLRPGRRPLSGAGRRSSEDLPFPVTPSPINLALSCATLLPSG